MNPSLRLQRGFTFVEITVATLVLMLVIAAFTPFIDQFTKGSSKNEAQTALKNEGETALRTMGYKMLECKRIFDRNSSDAAFLARVTMLTSTPAISGSLLPVKITTATITPSSNTFVPSAVGNSFFFANNEASRDMTCPTSPSGSTVSVRIDLYRFQYFYIAQMARRGQIGSQYNRNLLWWQSVPYADFAQLSSITDNVKRTTATITLFQSGVRWAWDSSTTTVTKAFYMLSSSGGLIASSTHTIQEYRVQEMIAPFTGISGGGFRYGVSPSSTTAFQPDPPTSRFARISGDFPSGFEVVITGPTSGRQVLLRLTLAAEGNFKGTLTKEATRFSTVRDVW